MLPANGTAIFLAFTKHDWIHAQLISARKNVLTLHTLGKMKQAHLVNIIIYINMYIYFNEIYLFQNYIQETEKLNRLLYNRKQSFVVSKLI